MSPTLNRRHVLIGATATAAVIAVPVSLALAAQPIADEAAAPGAVPSRPRALVIGGNTPGRNGLGEMLASSRFDAHVVSLRRDGLDLSGLERYVVALVDSDVPVREEILAMLRVARNVPPAISITPEDARYAAVHYIPGLPFFLETDSGGVLSRPFEPAKLLDSMERVIQRRERVRLGNLRPPVPTPNLREYASRMVAGA